MCESIRRDLRVNGDGMGIKNVDERWKVIEVQVTVLAALVRYTVLVPHDITHKTLNIDL